MTHNRGLWPMAQEIPGERMKLARGETHRQPPPPHLFSCTSWMFSMPMALLRREPNGPDFFRVGLFPGTIRDCKKRGEGGVSLSRKMKQGQERHSGELGRGSLPWETLLQS